MKRLVVALLIIAITGVSRFDMSFRSGDDSSSAARIRRCAGGAAGRGRAHRGVDQTELGVFQRGRTSAERKRKRRPGRDDEPRELAAARIWQPAIGGSSPQVKSPTANSPKRRRDQHRTSFITRKGPVREHSS